MTNTSQPFTFTGEANENKYLRLKLDTNSFLKIDSGNLTTVIDSDMFSQTDNTLTLNY